MSICPLRLGSLKTKAKVENEQVETHFLVGGSSSPSPAWLFGAAVSGVGPCLSPVSVTVTREAADYVDFIEIRTAMSFSPCGGLTHLRHNNIICSEQSRNLHSSDTQLLNV